MSFARKFLVAAALVAPIVGTASSKPPPPPPSFGLSVARTKIGDVARSDQALYGGGQHSMARVGTQLYIAYPVPEGGQTVAIHVGRSLDGGSTWLPSRVVVRGDGISDIGTPLAIGPDPAGAGLYRVHVTYEQNGAYYHAYATLDPAAGASGLGQFTPPIAVSGAVLVDGGGEHGVVADGVGGVHAAYVGVEGGVSNVVYSRSDDYGATFVEAGKLLVPTGRFPALAADSAGDVFLSYDVSDGVGGRGTYVARRAAGASAFGAPVFVMAADGEASIACADANRVYLASVRAPPTSQKTYHVARSTNGGQSWQVVDGPLGTGSCLFAPSIALSATGAIGIAWTDYCSGQGGFVWSTDGGSVWSTPAIIDSAPWGATLLFDDAGKANIAFVGSWPGEGNAVYFTKEN